MSKVTISVESRGQTYSFVVEKHHDDERALFDTPDVEEMVFEAFCGVKRMLPTVGYLDVHASSYGWTFKGETLTTRPEGYPPGARIRFLQGSTRLTLPEWAMDGDLLMNE